MSELLGSAYKQILLSNFIVSIQFLVLHTQIQLTFDHALFMIHSWLYLWTPNHISRGWALGLENPVILMSARLVLKPGWSWNQSPMDAEGCAQSVSRVQLFATPWTVACQDPLSMGFSRQEYWSGLPFLSPKKWLHLYYVTTSIRN